MKIELKDCPYLIDKKGNVNVLTKLGLLVLDYYPVQISWRVITDPNASMITGFITIRFVTDVANHHKMHKLLDKNRITTGPWSTHHLVIRVDFLGTRKRLVRNFSSSSHWTICPDLKELQPFRIKWYGKTRQVRFISPPPMLSIGCVAKTEIHVLVVQSGKTGVTFEPTMKF